MVSYFFLKVHLSFSSSIYPRFVKGKHQLRYFFFCDMATIHHQSSHLVISAGLCGCHSDCLKGVWFPYNNCCYPPHKGVDILAKKSINLICESIFWSKRESNFTIEAKIFYWESFFSVFICIFARTFRVSVVFCSTKISENSDMFTIWSIFCCSSAYNKYKIYVLMKYRLLCIQ